MPRHGAPQPDSDALRHTLSLSDVEARLIAAGVPRSHRHVQRLCRSGAFDAQLLPGASGDQWRIAPHSIEKVIGDLRAIEEQRARRGAPRHDTAHRVAPEPVAELAPDTARHGTPQHVTPQPENGQDRGATPPDTPRYVALLERENEFLRAQVGKKDEQIADLSVRFGNLSDRFADTQKLLGAMQRMLAPVLGQGDPFDVPEKRETSDPDLSPTTP